MIDVKKAMTEKLEKSLIDPATARKLKFKPCTAKECEALGLPANNAGFVIPYFDRHGRQTKFFRYRYLEDTRKGFEALGKKKPLRYGQVSNTLNEIYLPPLVDWHDFLENPAVPLVITEGELKAACATLCGIPTIGLGGVWCFMSTKKNKPLLPLLAETVWDGRTVYICYDSDAATNPDIVRAENVLARELTARNATVHITRIPFDEARKIGIDDYLLEHEVSDFTALLERSPEYEPMKALHEMCERVVYIRNPGIVYDYDNDMKLSATAFTQHAYSNLWHSEQRVNADGTIKMVKTSTSKAWLEWPQRNELSSITYAPGHDRITDKGELNVWPGWGIEPKKGDVKMWHAMMTHIFGDAKDARQWFERWCAYPMQNPGVKMAVSAVVWGVVHGSGKTLVANTLARIYGKNYAELKDADIENPRNEWAENKQFALGDDITGHDSRKLSRKFMTMITQKTIRLDIKYVPSFSIPDCINYYFTSNDPDAFYMEDGDRRFFIWEVLAGKLDIVFRKAYIEWMNSDDGAAALFYHLLNLPMGDFDPFHEAMVTDAKREMQLVGKSELGAWVAHLKESPDAVLNGKMRGDLFSAEELKVLFDPLGVKRASANAISRELKRAGFLRPTTTPVRTEGGMRRVFAIRNMEKWRNVPHRDIVTHYISSREIKRKF
jgi:hypothetical protein